MDKINGLNVIFFKQENLIIFYKSLYYFLFFTISLYHFMNFMAMNVFYISIF